MPVSTAERPIQVLQIALDAYIANCDLQYSHLKWYHFWPHAYLAYKNEAQGFLNSLNQSYNDLNTIESVINFATDYRCQHNEFKNFLYKALRQAVGLTTTFIDNYIDYCEEDKYVFFTLPIYDGNSPCSKELAYNDLKKAVQNTDGYHQFCEDLSNKNPALFLAINNYLSSTNFETPFFYEIDMRFIEKYFPELSDEKIYEVLDRHYKKAEHEVNQVRLF